MSDAETPRETPVEVQREVLRHRHSTHRAVRRAGLLALEILRTTGVHYAISDEDDLVATIAAMVSRAMQDHAREHADRLQRDVDDMSIQLAAQRRRGDAAVRAASRLRRAILVDYQEDGDLERLCRRAAGG